MPNPDDYPAAGSDAALIRRAIRVAMDGRGEVEPNPMVGCVIARDAPAGPSKPPVIIGEGRHVAFGQAHAEPTALADCREDPRGATAYVTLEPCCHTNKKTPPCAPQVIAAGIARVVVGCLDPNPAVDGQGVAMLRAAGVRVDHAATAVEAECRQLIAPFIAAQSNRPYVTMKWAEDNHGYVAGPGGERATISGPATNRLVHHLRARSDVVGVGAGTVIADDPALTPRGVPIVRPLRRWVFDRGLRSPADCQLFETAEQWPTTIFCDASAAGPQSRARYPAAVKIVGVDDFTLARAIAAGATESGITHVLVESGPLLAAGMFAENLVDRLWVIRAARRVGDATAPSAAAIPANFVRTATLAFGDDVVSEYLNTQSAAFFAAVPSADIVLATDSDADFSAACEG
ncbi:MAG TPA: bifunctional diaminohydroxyphosphoribosylaminopyrimidine deaminase/5-amino-6-(5-phosphoribosylamino)uracil reductase RibD [Tepidisphaeraceae bacterium]|jgi:diaminohydroxyphosphoribosylaminopyrimidine deaminase/5-amino-6-(5-phosphoribosylamino)uracil reductase